MLSTAIKLYLKACGDGFYGDQCSNKCGNCRDIDQCSPLNGKCLSGCVAGYQGDRCKTRKLKCNKKNVNNTNCFTLLYEKLYKGLFSTRVIFCPYLLTHSFASS